MSTPVGYSTVPLMNAGSESSAPIIAQHGGANMDDKTVKVFGREFSLRSQADVSGEFTADEKSILELHGFKDYEKEPVSARALLQAVYDQECVTDAQIDTIGKCGPMRAVLTAIANRLSGTLNDSAMAFGDEASDDEEDDKKYIKILIKVPIEALMATIQLGPSAPNANNGDMTDAESTTNTEPKNMNSASVTEEVAEAPSAPVEDMGEGEVSSVGEAPIVPEVSIVNEKPAIPEASIVNEKPVAAISNEAPIVPEVSIMNEKPVAPIVTISNEAQAAPAPSQETKTITLPPTAPRRSKRLGAFNITRRKRDDIVKL